MAQMKIDTGGQKGRTSQEHQVTASKTGRLAPRILTTTVNLIKTQIGLKTVAECNFKTRTDRTSWLHGHEELLRYQKISTTLFYYKNYRNSSRL